RPLDKWIRSTSSGFHTQILPSQFRKSAGRVCRLWASWMQRGVPSEWHRWSLLLPDIICMLLIPRGPPTMMTAVYDTRLSIALLTGFLGSGKTTFLNLLLKHPSMSKTAVLVNEFGQVGIDDLLIEATDGDTLLMASGCVCCTIRDSLVTSIIDLLERRAQAHIPQFERIIVETTGLAKPGPIIQTLASDPSIFSRVRLDVLIAVVDAVTGMATLTRYEEALAQAAVADTLVLSKTDLASDEALNAITTRLRAINPTALQVQAQDASLHPGTLLHGALYDPDTRTIDPSRWMKSDQLPDVLSSGQSVH